MLPVTEFMRFIRENALFSPNDLVLLAVSGGKDSVLMAHLFKLAGYRFGILHCNFNLRGEESQRDAAFVEALAGALDVPYHYTVFDTKAFAQAKGLSTQMAARSLRYDWFERIRRQEGAAYVAIAQHQTDAVETVLLNLTRGTGISGLHGIRPKREHLIRPLLFLNRQTIDKLVEAQQLDYVEDSSNESDTYARNRIRHHVLPVLKTINPRLETTWMQNILHFEETEQLLQLRVDELRQRLTEAAPDGTIRFPIAELKKLQPRQLLIFELLRPYEFTTAVVNDLCASLDAQTGARFLSSSHEALINRGTLILSKGSGEKLPDARRNHAPSEIWIQATDNIVCLGTQQLALRWSTDQNFHAHPDTAFVDAGKLLFPLTLRFKQQGDKFMPLGMSHFKKLSDLFIQRKIPLHDKANIPVLLNGNGEIIWVVGLQQDNRYKVTATTKKVAIFERLK